MKANETHFTEFLGQKQQFVIPIYQRTYSWTSIQCNQLWDDIIRISINDDVNAHFIGSIVYVREGLYNITDVPKSLVIDGQQRLTTLSLLLIALARVTKINDQNEEEIVNSFLINQYAKNDVDKVKLKLTKYDKEVYEKILFNRELLDNERISRMYQNYLFFYERIEKRKDDLDRIMVGIKKLIVVDIILDRKNDNPQLIFESLNSTGLDLSQSDLIRNFILMGLEDEQQRELYEKVWLPMERLFVDNKAESKFDYFVRAYLTLKLNAIPNISNVYEAFKRYMIDSGQEINSITEDLHTYAKYYACLDFGSEQDFEIHEVINNIKTLRVETAYPFLMQVYNDFKQNVLTKVEFIELLKLIEGYVFRRVICGIPTNSLNKTFASLYSEIDNKSYLESFKAVLLLKDGYRRFPKDGEFFDELQNKEVYSLRNCQYLLEKIEHFGNKERVEMQNLSIEHIMPQTLTSEWKSMLGSDFKDVQEKYLHTIGNLTFTGYNSDMSNKSFQEKKQIGFGNSNVRMNKYLMTLEKWDETEIINRAGMLGKDALTIWSLPKVAEDVLEKYRKTESTLNDYSLEDYQYLTGEMLSLYELLSTEIKNLSTDVKEEYMKLYIAFKLKTNFVDIVPQKNRLRLSLNMKFSEINDPRGIAKDITEKGRWGNGDVEVGLSNSTEIDYIMFLIRQSLDLQLMSN